ncbi:MAG TPA: flagellar basal-body MS-ring/collar protein FliF [Acetobacteraceae bacterium]|nr:flagellar basal-body MS-ring/collar protein FliF [Acetobacteraceae bacterium]
MKALLEGLRALGPARLAAMGAVTIGMLGMLALMMLRTGTEPMALLYGDLDLRDSAQVVDQLQRQHIPYRVAGNGSQILVAANQVADARLGLAKAGLPNSGSVGYEIFDRSDGFAATEFQQQINATRALEGEIARTLTAMHGVRSVRVHLVLPRREPFARDRQDAQASVMLTMAGAARLDREGVQAILNLIAAAVPGLRPQNIAIVDSRGDLLARAGEPVGAAATAMSTEEVRRGTELRLARAVEEMLERSVGAGHVRAEAAVRMSFDKVNETQERYDPDGQVTRSTQTVNSTSKSTEPAPTVSVQNNLPNADAGQQSAGSQEGRQEETTNYEISKSVRTLIKDQPQIDRISLAVIVDGTASVGPDGKQAWQPRSAEELDRIASLVKTAIGYDEKRGDHVEVASMRFVTEVTAPPEVNGILAMKLEKADLMHLAQTVLFGLIGIVALLLVLRPMVLRITAAAPGAIGGGGGAFAALAGPGGMPAVAGAGVPSALAGPALLPPLLEDESMVKIAQIEGQMRASSLRRITELVEKHPEETLAIVRGWMVQESG